MHFFYNSNQAQLKIINMVNNGPRKLYSERFAYHFPIDEGYAPTTAVYLEAEF
jgi:hypothetical protein